MSTEICYVINEKDFSLNLLHAAQVNSSALQFLLQSNLFFFSITSSQQALLYHGKSLL